MATTTKSIDDISLSTDITKQQHAALTKAIGKLEEKLINRERCDTLE